MTSITIDHFNYMVNQSSVEFKNTTMSLSNNVAILGINGIGKTRFLCKVSGILDDTIHLFINEGDNIRRLEKRELAVLHTDCRLIDYMSVERFVSLGRAFHSNISGELNLTDLKVVQYYLNYFNLLEMKDNSIENLSDGQKQRSQLARIFSQEAKVVLLDEPTSHLDLESKIKVMDQIKNLSRQNNQMIISSTHDFHLNIDSYDQIWLIDEKGFHLYSTAEFKSTAEYKKLNLR